MRGGSQRRKKAKEKAKKLNQLLSVRLTAEDREKIEQAGESLQRGRQISEATLHRRVTI